MAGKLLDTIVFFKKLLVFTENIIKQYENTTDTTIILQYLFNFKFQMKSQVILLILILTN